MRTVRLATHVLVVAVAAVLATAPAATAEDTAPWGVDLPRPVPGSSEAVDGPTEPAAELAAAGSSWTLSGSGWGHGVGMSQYGAYEMARDGYSAAEILAHYYTGTAYETRADTTTIRVNLRHRVGSTRITSSALSSGGGSFSVAVSGGRTITGGVGDVVTITPGDKVSVRCSGCSGTTSSSGVRADVTFDDDRTLVVVDGTSYRDGLLRVTRSPDRDSLEAVLYARLHDEYLDYIREVPWSWPAAALEAQAAAARGYALRKQASGVDAACNCHLYDDTRSQVFGGYPTSSGDQRYLPAWKDAVDAAGSSSQGFVATYGGTIIEAYYSSSSGGRTQNSEDVWTAALPYLRSVDDHWGVRSSNPRSSWTSRPSRSALASAFGLSDVARLDLSDRYVSGGVATARATSAAGVQKSLSGESLRSRLGLYSSYLSRPTTRAAGADRYATAAALAGSHLPSATTVVIASGEDSGRPDAAVGGPLAQSLGAPLLLTRTDRLPAATRAEIADRSGTLTRAVVVGGASAVSEDVVDALESRGLRVTRIGGANRYDVAAEVAEDIDRRGAVSAVVLASGTSLVDALGAGGPAGAVREPILLTRPDALPAAASAALRSTGAGTVRVLGGESAVSASVEDGLRGDGLKVSRISGSNRYVVASKVASYYRPRLSGATEVSLASGADSALADALTAGSVGRITLLTGRSRLPEESAQVLQESGDLARVVVVGGDGVISSSVVTAAARS